jgi:ABC-type microcin C transport system permease subunit YejE
VAQSTLIPLIEPVTPSTICTLLTLEFLAFEMVRTSAAVNEIVQECHLQWLSLLTESGTTLFTLLPTWDCKSLARGGDPRFT